MHSLSSYQKTVDTLHTQNYQTINLFLDNDQSGVDVAFQFLKDIPTAVNQSDLFHPHEDLNAFLLASANSSDIPNASPLPRTSAGSRAAKGAEREGKLKSAQAQETQLTAKLEEATDQACRTIFNQHPGAKANAFAEATNHPASGYKANRSIAENMATPKFRRVFKKIVQERYPEQFARVADLKKEVSKVRSAISRLK
jgi:hypothetical protein